MEDEGLFLTLEESVNSESGLELKRSDSGLELVTSEFDPDTRNFVNDLELDRSEAGRDDLSVFSFCSFTALLSPWVFNLLLILSTVNNKGDFDLDLDFETFSFPEAGWDSVLVPLVSVMVSWKRKELLLSVLRTEEVFSLIL